MFNRINGHVFFPKNKKPCIFMAFLIRVWRNLRMRTHAITGVYTNKSHFLDKNCSNYRGSPTYTKITNTISTNTVFGLCTCKWGN